MRRSSRPLVTVIMAARNTAAFIGGAIESALAQTYRQIELIVIDDHSTDDTVAVADRYARRDPRVRVISGSFGTPSAARNRAIAAARGEWFALLDSDDLWTPAFLERQFALLEAHPGAMLASGNALNLGGPFDGRPLDRCPRVRALRFPDLLRDETSVCIMTVFKRDVVEVVGGFDEALVRNEDFDLWLRATHAGFVIVKNPEPLGRYRRRPDSLSSNEEAMLAGILAVYRKLEAWRLSRAEREIARAQIARFEQRKLMLEAKRTLRSCDFAAAAALFEDLARQDGRWKTRVAALAARHCPRPFLRLVALRDGA